MLKSGEDQARLNTFILVVSTIFSVMTCFEDYLVNIEEKHIHYPLRLVMGMPKVKPQVQSIAQVCYRQTFLHCYTTLITTVYCQ